MHLRHACPDGPGREAAVGRAQGVLERVLAIEKPWEQRGDRHEGKRVSEGIDGQARFHYHSLDPFL